MTNQETQATSGNAMNLNEQGGEYLRLRREQNNAQLETAATLAFLRRFGQTLDANAKIIKHDASMWSADAESFVIGIREAVQKADRYRDLLAQGADITAALDRFMLE